MRRRPSKVTTLSGSSLAHHSHVTRGNGERACKREPFFRRAACLPIQTFTPGYTILRYDSGEALLTLGAYGLYFVWWYACAYGLGDGDPEGYDYIFGLPAWFFLSCIAGYPLLSALLWFMVRRFFKDIPLDEEGGAPKREGLEVTDERHPEAF